MRLLGLSCGNPNGSAEILLKSAIRAAGEHQIDANLVRLTDLRFVNDLAAPPQADDAAWMLEQILAADALIVGTPIINRTVPGPVKMLIDRVLGPKTDVIFSRDVLQHNDSPDRPQPLGISVAADPRTLKPRVAGFIAIGGCKEPLWRTLALPVLHALTFSMQVAVADQVEFRTETGLGAAVLDEMMMTRAAQLGDAVASQVGRSFSEVEYRGAPGLCPMCHLNAVVMRPTHVECATCGAYGEFVTTDSGVTVDFSGQGLSRSVIGIPEKQSHYDELVDSAINGPAPEVVAAAADPWWRYGEELAARP